MLQNFCGNIIPASGVWLLKTPSSSNVLRWVKLVHNESFLFSLGNCRQLRLTLPHACLMSLGCFLLPLRMDDLVATQGTHEQFNSWKKKVTLSENKPWEKTEPKYFLLSGVYSSKRACAPTGKGSVCVTLVPTGVWSGVQLLLIYSEVFEKRCPTNYQHQQEFNLFL